MPADHDEVNLPLWVTDDLPSRPFSSSAMRKVGEALATGETLTDAQSRLYTQYNDHYGLVEQALRLDVADRLDHDGFLVPVRVGSRLKSRPTVLAKLRKNSQFDRIRDLIGVRVVLESGTRNDQDRVVECLARAYGSGKPIDRRTDPRSGYRAVHLEVVVANARAEIQVRTPLQHEWAELSERAADRWGRELRYGGTPEGFTPSRQRGWETIQKVAVAIDVWERAQAEMASASLRRRAKVVARHPVRWSRSLKVPELLADSIKGLGEVIDDLE